MDVHCLTGLLQGDPIKIADVLEALGYEPKDRGSYYQMKNLDGDNPTAIAVWKNSLNYNNYTRAKNGNIITLIMDVKGYSFPKALQWLAKELGVANAPIVKIKYPFGGFYRKLQADDADKVVFTKYSENDLPPNDSLSYRFFKEGIDYQTQEYFGVRYDHVSNAIIIPVHDWYGRLIGAKARINSDTDGQRWYAYLPYPKTGILYGWNANYKNIIEKGICIVTESEKGVMQLYSMGVHVGLALGGHDISKVQVRYLKSLKCKIILSLDEDITEEEVEKQAAKLDGCDVWMIKDRVHKYLPFGSKASPTDFGMDVFKKLLKECLVKCEVNNRYGVGSSD